MCRKNRNLNPIMQLSKLARMLGKMNQEVPGFSKEELAAMIAQCRAANADGVDLLLSEFLILSATN